MGRPLRRPFLRIEPRNLWPEACWPGGGHVGAARGYGNAGGSWPYIDGMPRHWSIYDNGTNAQWDWNFGSHGGERYFDWRWWDTANWGSTFAEFGTRTSRAPAATVGQVYELGFYVAFAPGSNVFPSILGVVWDELDAGLGYLATTQNNVFSSPSTQVPRDVYRPIRMAANMTVAQGSTAFIAPGIHLEFGANTSADQCILRVFKPFLRRVS